MLFCPNRHKMETRSSTQAVTSCSAQNSQPRNGRNCNVVCWSRLLINQQFVKRSQELPVPSAFCKLCVHQNYSIARTGNFPASLQAVSEPVWNNAPQKASVNPPSPSLSERFLRGLLVSEHEKSLLQIGRERCLQTVSAK